MNWNSSTKELHGFIFVRKKAFVCQYGFSKSRPQFFCYWAQLLKIYYSYPLSCLILFYSQFGWSKKSYFFAIYCVNTACSDELLSSFTTSMQTPIFWSKQIKVFPRRSDIHFRFRCPSSAIGLWIFAWSVPPMVHIHGIVSMVGFLLAVSTSSESIHA